MGIDVTLEGAIEEFQQYSTAVPLTISHTLSDQKPCFWKNNIDVTKNL